MDEALEEDDEQGNRSWKNVCDSMCVSSLAKAPLTSDMTGTLQWPEQRATIGFRMMNESIHLIYTSGADDQK